MNRRSFLAALPLVPAALAALPSKASGRVVEPLIFGTHLAEDGRWIAGNGTAETWREVEEPGRPRPIVYGELVPGVELVPDGRAIYLPKGWPEVGF